MIWIDAKDEPGIGGGGGAVSERDWFSFMVTVDLEDFLGDTAH